MPLPRNEAPPLPWLVHLHGSGRETFAHRSAVAGSSWTRVTIQSEPFPCVRAPPPPRGAARLRDFDRSPRAHKPSPFRGAPTLRPEPLWLHHVPPFSACTYPDRLAH